MALPDSGVLSLDDIQTEFGGTNPISLSEYYRGGAYTTSNNTNVPTSGAISLSNFYGAVKEFAFTISSNQQEMNLSTYATALGWDGAAPISATIASGVYIWSDSRSTGALTIPSSLNGLVTITNNGYIIGRGGNGGSLGSSGQSGGPALVNQATDVTLTNASGAFIAGGGGGGAGYITSTVKYAGGGGAGGGDGGTQHRGYHVPPGFFDAGGAGGSVGNSGGDGTSNTGSGGGSGGSGSHQSDGGAGGGGRILPGVGGVSRFDNAGAGGTANAAGGSGAPGGAGGGGWGAAGGSASGVSGGAGGAAISGTAIATYTNNGTVYGSTP